MKAIAISAIDGPEVLEPGEQPEPKAKKGEVKIKVRAFGLNRAEIYYRSGNMGTTEIGVYRALKPWGKLVTDPSGTFSLGQKVVTVMGGMMLARDGSYTEYVTAPLGNVLAIDSDIAFPLLASFCYFRDKIRGLMGQAI